MFYRALRRPSMMKVQVKTATTSFRTNIQDVSATGAKIKSGDNLVPGQPVSLSIGRVSVTAEVVWCRAGEAGLLFKRPLASRDLAELAGTRAPTRTPEKRRWLYDGGASNGGRPYL